MKKQTNVQVRLQYGAGDLVVDIPSENVTVIEPQQVPGLADEAAAFRAAVRAPIESSPLRDLIRSTDRVAVVIPDITRPLPTDRLLPWLFEELGHVDPERYTIINGTGSHRNNTSEELAAMVGADVAARYRIVNHTSGEPETLAVAGTDLRGHPHG